MADAPPEPFVSALVELRPDADQGVVGRAKQAFGQAGFEVHAPLGVNFSIAARQSVFERVFGKRIVVDQEQLPQAVTTEEGELELPIEGAPESVRADVHRVAFLPAPDFGV